MIGGAVCRTEKAMRKGNFWLVTANFMAEPLIDATKTKVVEKNVTVLT